MPSPFPGMDPWLEAPGVFPDLHSSFATYLRAALTAVLPAPFFAAISTRVYMEESDRRTEPDVDVFTPPLTDFGNDGGGTATLTRSRPGVFEIPAQPWPDEEITESFVEIRSLDGEERLITSIELLSPTNKRKGANGRGLYLAKQQEMRLQGVHLVEIDLLRAGSHATNGRFDAMQKTIGRYDYHVCISHAGKKENCSVIPIMMESPLPSIDVPLTSTAGSAAVNLQLVLDRCYDEGGYSRRVHYSRECQPPLTPQQRLWAESVLREKGLLVVS